MQVYIEIAAYLLGIQEHEIWALIKPRLAQYDLFESIFATISEMEPH
jgi:hypothetical protein